GASPYMSQAAFIEVYSALIRALSQRESLDAIICGDHHFNPAVRARIPAIPATIAAIEAAARPLVLERQFHWADLESAITLGGRRDQMIGFDGVHMTAEAHRRVAAALCPLIAEIATAPAY